MRIKKIHIRNFRGFEQKSFTFDESITVIVGNNTAGKTTLIQAVKIALGAYLKSIKSLPSDAAYKCNFSTEDKFSRFNPVTKDFINNDTSTRIDTVADFPVSSINGNSVIIENSEIRWYRELKGTTTIHSHECAGELIDAVHNMELKRDNSISDVSSIYPLVLSFGSNRIDNQYRTAKKSKERDSKIARAYKSALKETVDFQSAFDWLYRYDLALKRGEVFEGTFSAFIDALTTAIPSLSEIHVDTKNNELSARVSVRDLEPVYQTFEHMSDGFKSIICIVAEIAHRCIELNGFLKHDAVKRTPGVVLIDELDLYLHPRWQQHILNDLHNAFPNIQFIVSTHSPFVVQSVKSKNIITLDGVKSATDPIYRSIEEIAASEMNMENTLRSAKFREMLNIADEYFKMVREQSKNTEAAEDLKRRINDIELEFSDNPAYVSLLRAEKNRK